MNNNDLILYYYNKCVTNGFPLENFNIDYIKKEYIKLCILNVDKFKNSNICLDIIYNYHPSLWKANKKGNLSPYESWYNDSKLIQCIENRLKYKGNNLTPNQIRAGFTISGIAPKVSIFRPYIAKYLINKYLNNYNEIFDPCSGYSARLLASSVLDKKYIGYDINATTVNESKKLITDLNLSNIELYNKNSICSKGEYECLFTCPPYGGKENWNMSIEELTCDEWITICLKNYKCKKYLFVVDNTEKYKNYIVEKLVSKSHFSGNTEYVILINGPESEE